ncbi:hypothetical protein F4678DRAFT_467069 [Xylaria arbuscula]|nr:hypothetical protein F4678DRAFT_467069 [Xylaria arbuscula]
MSFQFDQAPAGVVYAHQKHPIAVSVSNYDNTLPWHKIDKVHIQVFEEDADGRGRDRPTDVTRECGWRPTTENYCVIEWDVEWFKHLTPRRRYRLIASLLNKNSDVLREARSEEIIPIPKDS